LHNRTAQNIVRQVAEDQKAKWKKSTQREVKRAQMPIWVSRIRSVAHETKSYIKAKAQRTEPMISRAPSFLLAVSAALQMVGAFVHAGAFKHASAAFAESNLRAFFGNSSKALWLGDSTTLFITALLCGLVALRPSAATKPVVMLLAFIPAATAILIYVFLGSFFAGHLLLVSGAAIFFAGLQFPGAKVQTTRRAQV